jgi:hypothetical protein
MAKGLKLLFKRMTLCQNFDEELFNETIYGDKLGKGLLIRMVRLEKLS